ncbi:MAG: hypothetical protein NTV86_17195 [Planctomycetota bacterium]|nr:hypothetical protein [Planctomycetota bacterium]
MTDTQTKTERRGMRNLRTAVSGRIRSKPCVEGQRYLDLYVLQRDRFRWMRLIHQSERSIRGIDLAMAKMGFSPTDGESPGAKAADEPAARGKTIQLGTSKKHRRSA